MKRDVVVDLVKAVGIICVVIGHSSCPEFLRSVIYSFHMPLFFIASGLFFKEKYLYSKKDFFVKKVKGLYIPFVCFSTLFLLLHNFFVYCGVLNSSYGSSIGTVSKYYSLVVMLKKMICILFFMSCYENFLLGAFWFFRALFGGSILICFFSYLLSNFCSPKKSIVLSALLFYFLAGFLKYFEISLPEGLGYRECMAAFFIGIGYFSRENFLCFTKLKFLSMAAVFGLSNIIYPCSMDLNCSIFDWLVIPVSGVSGFYVLYNALSFIAKSDKVKLLSFIGENSIWILTFHFLSFKLSALIEIWAYGLPFAMIGCHPVIPAKDNYFFLIHSLFGIILPLIICLAFHFCKKKLNDVFFVK